MTDISKDFSEAWAWPENYNTVKERVTLCIEYPRKDTWVLCSLGWGEEERETCFLFQTI